MEEIYFSFLSPNELREANGSEPGERIKMRGVSAVESRYIFARSKGGGSTNFLPHCSTIMHCLGAKNLPIERDDRSHPRP
jgi:hypothetical protein